MNIRNIELTIKIYQAQSRKILLLQLLGQFRDNMTKEEIVLIIKNKSLTEGVLVKKLNNRLIEVIQKQRDEK